MQLFGPHALSIAFTLTCLISTSWGWPMWKSTHRHFEKRNFNTISSIYNLTVYPNQLPVIRFGGAGVPKGLFSQNVTGRVDPVGQFTDFEDSIEYFFALAPIPQENGVSIAITGYKITEFSSACPDVAASVVYLYCSIVKPGFPEDGTPLAPLKQVSFHKSQALLAVVDFFSFFSRLTPPGGVLEFRQGRSSAEI